MGELYDSESTNLASFVCIQVVFDFIEKTRELTLPGTGEVNLGPLASLVRRLVSLGRMITAREREQKRKKNLGQITTNSGNSYKHQQTRWLLLL